MKIEYKQVGKNSIQITTSDERWYKVENTFYPSLTWILSHYPKGKQMEAWLKNNGNDSDRIRDEAAVRGSKVHQALEVLKTGKEVKHDDLFLNTQTNKEEELTGEQYGAIISWVEWVKENNPIFLLNETTLYSEKYGFACTLDDVFLIGDQLYINDIKTSKSIYDTHKMQVSAVKRALLESISKKRISIKATKEQILNAKLSILQINGTLNKKGVRFTEIEDDFDGFILAKNLWEREVAKKTPLQRDYPLSIKI